MLLTKLSSSLVIRFRKATASLNTQHFRTVTSFQWPSFNFWSKAFRVNNQQKGLTNFNMCKNVSEVLKQVENEHSLKYVCNTPELMRGLLRNALFKHLQVSETQMPYRVWLSADIFKVRQQILLFEHSTFNLFLPLYHDETFKQALSLLPSTLERANANEILEIYSIFQFFPALHRSTLFQDLCFKAQKAYAKADYSAIYACEMLHTHNYSHQFHKTFFNRLKQDLSNPTFIKSEQSLYAIGVSSMYQQHASSELSRLVFSSAVEVARRHISVDDPEVVSHFVPILSYLSVSHYFDVTEKERFNMEDLSIRLLNRALEQEGVQLTSVQLERLNEPSKAVRLNDH